MTSCFCCETQSKSSDVEGQELATFKFYDEEDFEDVEVEEERYDSLRSLYSKLYFYTFVSHFIFSCGGCPTKSKYVLKVLWVYLTLIWLCFLDEGTDIYGAYQHYL